MAENFDKAVDGLREMIVSIQNAGKEVFLILNIPISNKLSPNTMLVRRLPWSAYQTKVEYKSTISRSEWLEFSDHFRKPLLEMAIGLKIKVIDPADFLCEDVNCSTALKNGYPIYRDSSSNYGHLSGIAARKLATFIDQTILINPHQ